jgi:hypothetical protein
MSEVYRYKPTNLSTSALGSNVLAAFYVARREDLLNGFGKRVSVLAVYPDGSVSPTVLNTVIKQIREDSKNVDLFHVMVIDGNREIPIVVI